MRDYEDEDRVRLRVILGDNPENRWMRYWIDSEGDSIMEVLEVFAASEVVEVFRKEGRRKLELRRPWQTLPGDREKGKLIFLMSILL